MTPFRGPNTGTTPELHRNQKQHRNPIVETGVPVELPRNLRSASSLPDSVPVLRGETAP